MRVMTAYYATRVPEPFHGRDSVTLLPVPRPGDAGDVGEAVTALRRETRAGSGSLGHPVPFVPVRVPHVFEVESGVFDRDEHLVLIVEPNALFPHASPGTRVE